MARLVNAQVLRDLAEVDLRGGAEEEHTQLKISAK